MDLDQSPSAPRKSRFAPKQPPRRKANPTERKTEVVDDDDEATQALLKRVHEHLGRRGAKVEKKSAVQVAFDGAASATFIRAYGIPKERNLGKTSGSDLEGSASGGGSIFSSHSTAELDGTSGRDLTDDASYQKKKKDYKEPWDYHHTDYPMTLPLRRPYSGNPELLDAAEFGNDAMNIEYDENTLNPASELGLLEGNKEARMFFLQLPPTLPLVKRSATVDGEVADRSKSLKTEGSLPRAKGKEIAGISMSSERRVDSASAKGKTVAGGPMSLGDSGSPARAKGNQMVSGSISWGTGVAPKKHCSLEELPGGYMGKMLVYKSGAVKLKLGDTLYDVSPGSDCFFAQDIAAINPAKKECTLLGELGKHAIVTPDIDSLLN